MTAEQYDKLLSLLDNQSKIVDQVRISTNRIFWLIFLVIFFQFLAWLF